MCPQGCEPSDSGCTAPGRALNMYSRSKDLGLQQTHSCSGDDNRVQQGGQLCSHLSLTAGSHSETHFWLCPAAQGKTLPQDGVRRRPGSLLVSTGQRTAPFLPSPYDPSTPGCWHMALLRVNDRSALWSLSPLGPPEDRRNLLFLPGLSVLPTGGGKPTI